ncbi:putative methylated-DNA-[protein]-cysteine S-methyltransferase, DNA binding protein [Plasmopara halstedii]
MKVEQKRELRSKHKPTQRILWRGKLITMFESRVYELIAKIPRGKVSTYGGVAKALQSGPRCVGQALRKNPFAPGIPCHRVVAATLDIGGFQGASGEASPSIQKKRALLAEEGVIFTNDHKIDPASLFDFNLAAD